jgi:RNA polymerase primary sigma factor
MARPPDMSKSPASPEATAQTPAATEGAAHAKERASADEGLVCESAAALIADGTQPTVPPPAAPKVPTKKQRESPLRLLAPKSRQTATKSAESGAPVEPGAVPKASSKRIRADRRGKGDDQEFLRAYFKDVTRVSVLTPAAEYELARRIGIMEEVLWVQALSLSHLISPILELLAQAIGRSLAEFQPLWECGVALIAEGKHQGRELSLAAQPLAVRLRQLDLDRLYVAAVMAEIHRLEQERIAQPQCKSAVSEIPTEIWQKYLQGMSVIVQLISRGKEDFVKANLRLVVSIANKLEKGKLPLADMIQDGNLGLIKAVERFDYRRGFRFSTYASWWIRHAIADGLALKTRMIRLPIHMQGEYQVVVRARTKLAGELGRQPTSEELSKEVGISPDKLSKLEGFINDESVSLEREISANDERCYADFLSDEKTVISISERLIGDSMLQEVNLLLKKLSPIEADILRMRFGLGKDDEQEMTFKEIGEKYNLSRERIRQLHELALRRMRRVLTSKDLI